LEDYDEGDAKALVQRIHQHVDAFRLLHAVQLGEGAIAATGGNANALAKIAGKVAVEGVPGTLPVAELQRLRADLEAVSVKERMQRFGLRADRADVIVPAAIVFERVAQIVGATQIQVPGTGLREGIALDLLDEAADPTGRLRQLERTVEDACLALGRTLALDEKHAIQVARLALRLFDLTSSLHGLGDVERRVLHAAALLHDVGRSLGDKGHDKHSAYIIENADIAGLSRGDARLAAAVARYHRRAVPRPEHRLYRSLHRDDQAKVRRLAAVLRIADALDRGHDDNVRELQVELTAERLEVRPLVERPLGLEPLVLARKADLFESEFKRRVVIQDA
jgi:exopolyphosphatase/guanosine-5'-triphosphate,3'-diphosphate pyrophosphatase